MEASTPSPEAAAVAVDDRRPLGDLLPTEGMRVLVVLAGVLLAVGSVAQFGWSGRTALGVVLCPTLVLLAAIDLQHRLLPNAIVFPAALLVALLVAAFDPGGFTEHLEAGLALFGFFFVFALAYPAGLGMGDAKVGLLIGLALGARTLPAMMAALLALFCAGVWVLARHGLGARKESLPFGPFLALGAILAFFLT